MVEESGSSAGSTKSQDTLERVSPTQLEGEFSSYSEIDPAKSWLGSPKGELMIGMLAALLCETEDAVSLQPELGKIRPRLKDPMSGEQGPVLLFSSCFGVFISVSHVFWLCRRYVTSNILTYQCFSH